MDHTPHSALPNPFPALDAVTEAALTESIRRFGVLVPVVRDQHGRTLDGHHRSRIADALGLEYRVDVVTVESDEHAREIAVSLNADRRHLSIDQRREIVATLREAGHSTRAIARAVGVDPKTIRNDIAGGEMSPPAEVTGQDGKTYPARRPAPPEPAPTPSWAVRVLLVADQLRRIAHGPPGLDRAGRCREALALLPDVEADLRRLAANEDPATDRPADPEPERAVERAPSDEEAARAERLLRDHADLLNGGAA